MKRFYSVAVASVLACMLVAPAQAYQCKSSAITAVGVHNLKFRAHNTAPRNWTKRVKDKYGLAWSVHKIAQSKSISCDKVEIAGVKKWRCIASAKPCLYVVP